MFFAFSANLLEIDLFEEDQTNNLKAEILTVQNADSYDKHNDENETNHDSASRVL